MKKDFLSILDFNRNEITDLLTLALRLKRDLRKGKRPTPLKNKVVALIFDKPSLRTHATFETGIVQLGGHSLYLPGTNVRLGVRESARDVARNLERWIDGVVVRTFSHAMLEELARTAKIPVINALTDDHHPCQALATGLTLLESFGSLKGLKVAYVGDGNNVAVSLFDMCVRLGLHCAIAAPKDYRIRPEFAARIAADAKKNGVRFEAVTDPKEAVRNADLVYTDVWASMGQESETAQRKKIFKPYQVNARLMALANPHARFSHCLPAHRGDEATDEVLDGKQSVIFDEAENRLHVQKAVLVRLLG